MENIVITEEHTLSEEELSIRREDDRALFANGISIELQVDDYLLEWVEEEQKRRMKLLFKLLKKKPKTKKKQVLKMPLGVWPTEEEILEHFKKNLREPWHFQVDEPERHERLLERIRVRRDAIRNLFSQDS